MGYSWGKQQSSSSVCVSVLTLLLVTLVFFSITTPAYAAERLNPLRGLFMIASQETSETARLTIYGFAPDDVELPYTASFSLPATYKILEFHELDKETGASPKDAVFEVVTAELMHTITVTFQEAHAFIVGCSIEGNFLETGQMGKDTVLVRLYYTPLTDLENLTLAFVSPEGMKGAGKDIVHIGEDDDGNAIYGLEFAEVKAGEETGGSIAFIPIVEEPEDTVEPEAPQQQPWYTRFSELSYVIGLLCLLVLMAIALLIWIIKKSEKRNP